MLVNGQPTGPFIDTAIKRLEDITAGHVVLHQDLWWQVASWEESEDEHEGRDVDSGIEWMLFRPGERLKKLTGAPFDLVTVQVMKEVP